MRRILDRAVELFREAGIREVYPSFDAVPLAKKSDRLFTVLGLESVQLDAPFPDGRGGVYPFAATLKVSVLVPMDAPLCRAEAFFYEKALPVLRQFGAVPGEAAPAAVDVKLQRVVMTAKLRIRGLYADGDEVRALQEVTE